MAVAGKNGKVVIGSGGEEKVVGIKSWSLELSLETLETTALGDDWKNYIAGLKEWTASSEGDYEVPVDATGQQALQDAFLNGSLSIEDPVDDVVSISIEFTGTGALTFETGE